MKQLFFAAAAIAVGTVPIAASTNNFDSESVLISNAGDIIPAAPESATASFGVSPSWRGTGAMTEIAAIGTDRRTQPASFPHDGSVIGFDGRVRVRHTQDYPARATAFITFRQGKFKLSCTGWLIAKDTVAPAGHCVNGGPGFGNLWSKGVTVYPGRNGSSSPYGSCAAVKLWTNKSWLANGDEEHDYGAIKLDCTIGEVTGWYGLFWQKGSLTGIVTRTRGYPNDKHHGTQWLSKDCGDGSSFARCHVMITERRVLYYDNDTMGGQSGSPVYENRSDSCNPCAMAIHGYGTDSVHIYNSGARITQSVYNFLSKVVKM